MLPTHVQLGPVRYTVERVPSVDDSSDGGLKVGQIRFAEARIVILDRLPDDRALVTLWHELVHGLFEVAGQDNDDEGLVDALAYGLVDLFRNNGWTITMPEGGTTHE